jgi:hypothetical protein
MQMEAIYSEIIRACEDYCLTEMFSLVEKYRRLSAGYDAV